MNLIQISKNRMYKNVLGFFSANSAALASFTRLAKQIKLFTVQNATLNKFIEQQAQTSRGYTGDKNSILAALVANTVNTARKALVYAIDQSNEVLKEILSVQKTDFTRLPQDAALAKIQNIYDAVSPLADALLLYNVSAEDIAAISDGIDNFKAAQPGTGNSRASRKAGTQGIKTTMAVIDASLRVLDDLIIHGITDGALVSEYRNNRKTDVVGTRHTGIIATTNNAMSGAKLPGVKMEVAALNKSAISNLLGVAEIITMKPGLYQVAFSAEGFVSQTQVLKIKRGNTLEVSVNLAQLVQEMELVKVA
jgi:hypothetical protein